MNNYTDISFEDYIMADEIKDSTKNSNDYIVQKEMEDLENLDENIEKQKMEVLSTDIICDGSGFQNLIEKLTHQNQHLIFQNINSTTSEFLIMSTLSN